MSTRHPISHQRLTDCLAYDPASGAFAWKKKTCRRIMIGDVAGTINGRGYIAIRIDGTIYLAHRLAWFYMTGAWPANDVDHRDTVRTNNQWANLREATQAQNLRNSRQHSDSKSPFKGVTRANQPGEAWCARIWVGGRMVNLGTFATPEDASAAYERTAIEHFGEFARAA